MRFPSGARARVAALAVPALVALAGLAASGCTDKAPVAKDLTPGFEFSGNAATVNGVVIPASTIGDLVKAYQDPAVAQVAIGEAVNDISTGQAKPTIVADLVQNEISVQLIEAELKKRSITVSQEDLRAADLFIKSRFGDSASKLGAGLLAQTIQRYAEFVALDKVLAPAPATEAELRKTYDKEPTKYQLACVRHILMTDRALAATLRDQLKAGADFAALAKTNSKDSSSAVDGGDLGCVPPGAFADAFEDATWKGPIGEIQGPVETEFGLHLIQVTRRGQATFDEVKDALAEQAAGDPFTSLGIFVQSTMLRSTITVDPRYGTWDPNTISVKPLGSSVDDLKITPQIGPSATVTTAGTGR